MQTARGVRSLGYGLYGVITAVALFGFWKPEAYRILLISSGLIAIACVTLVVVGVRKTVSNPDKRWAPGEGWVIYGMYATAIANLTLVYSLHRGYQ